MMKTAAALIAILATGCSQRVYSPPSQAFSLAPHGQLAQGQRALDVEVSRNAQIFDPAVHTGAGRLRTGVGDNTEVSIEGTVMSVDEYHPTTETEIYAGRLGVRTSPGGGDFSLYAGAGGGYAPAGGSFTAVDAGASLAIENCVLVPVIQGGGFISKPVDARPIDVSDQSDRDDGIRTFDTPSRTFGGVLRAGLRLSLSPSTCRRGEQSSWVYAGLGFTWLSDHDSNDELVGIGVGLTVPL